MSEARSSKNSDFAAEKALVDKAAIAPLPNSEKIYVTGSRADIQVPMRKISQSETPTDMGGEKNPPIFVYDTTSFGHIFINGEQEYLTALHFLKMRVASVLISRMLSEEDFQQA